MREIKFRGKDNITGEWVFGSFIPDALEGSNSDLISWGFIRRYNRGVGKMETIEVDRETVGQYTGLKDKNGTEIYEGDIIFRQDEVGRIEFSEDGSFLIRFPHHLARMNATWGPIEVIGNIHDNPELLGGAG
jgi:uncharacterized phage protein (TIGR01671 family)